MPLFSSDRGALRSVAILGLFAASMLWPAPGQGEASRSPIRLPIEVMGPNGTTAGILLQLPKASAEQACALWLQIHGMEYPDLASVRVNGQAWVPLNNQTATVMQPGRSYGGIGGAFATLKMTLPLARGSLIEGENRIDFRFNRTDGVVSGFRVLALNLLRQDGERILSPDRFVEEDPGGWLAPLLKQQDAAEGERLWQSAALRASSLSGAPMLRAHCSDCHARDGRDLKYFNYSNLSIVARAEFHGLSEQQGQQIASYIRSLPLPHPGRPWNPPYQPGPGMQMRTSAELAAGAGLDAVLDEDEKTLTALSRGYAGADAFVTVFDPDGDLPLRQIPIAMPLPDWNHWLPRVHPLDIWGDKFSRSDFNRLYTAWNDREAAPRRDTADFFARWLKARSKFLAAPKTPDAAIWSPGLARSLYATLLWQITKTWEISQRYSLETAQGDVVWNNLVAAETAPAAVNIPDSPDGMGGSGLTNEYFNNAWYELQMLLNSGGHRHNGREPVDWVYMAGHERALERWSGRPEPGRVLVTAIAATQSTAQDLGPQDVARGWRPERTIDPRMMVAPEWAETFAGLPADERQAVTEAWLQAWLDKCTRYPVVSYFRLGQLSGSYEPSKELRGVSGGKVWESASKFRDAGVDARLVDRLQLWGSQYMAVSSLFQY